MRYYQLVVLGLLALAAGSCKQAAPSGASATRTARPNDALFPIVVQGRWGFIDSTGAVVIAPRFAEVQEFSEGLAPVREAGHYGYLNKAGKFILPQTYAFATPFRGGMALIEQDSVPRLIDHAGKAIALPATYRRLEWEPSFDHGGNWVGNLPTYKNQLLDQHGRLLIPAQFVRIRPLSNNRRVVVIAVPSPDKDGPPETELTGVLDGRGRLVIPYRRFDRISTFREGLATASLHQEPNDDRSAQECIIDTLGRILARLPKSERFTSLEDSQFSDGSVVVDISKDGRAATLDNSYPAVLDRTGRVLLRQPHLRTLSAFRHDRAWAQRQDDTWYLIDKTGRQLSPTIGKRLFQQRGFEDAPTFPNGAEVVELADGKGCAALDSMGRVVRRLTQTTGLDASQQFGDILTLYATDSTRHVGFWNWRTGLLVRPRFSSVSAAGYQHGLLAVVEDQRLGYLSAAGRYVWREAPQTSAPLNLDYQRRSFYSVASPPLRRYAGVGGWAPSGNLPKPVAGQSFPPRALTVRVGPRSLPNALAPALDGYSLNIANTTADTVVFDAQDSSLYLTVQAQDARGRWRDIEYIPSSFCGNSYHQVFLAPGRYWQLTVPAYRGELATRLRAKLLLRYRNHPTRPAQQQVVYSNEVAGSVNPAQFWHRQGYNSQGLMDPYLN
jgi:hypothetical protein